VVENRERRKTCSVKDRLQGRGTVHPLDFCEGSIVGRSVHRTLSLTPRQPLQPQNALVGSFFCTEIHGRATSELLLVVADIMADVVIDFDHFDDGFSPLRWQSRHWWWRVMVMIMVVIVMILVLRRGLGVCVQILRSLLHRTSIPSLTPVVQGGGRR
jgi:hypothetical protein